MQNPLLLILAVPLTTLSSFEGATVRQQSPASAREATVCDLSKTPDAWNHVRVRLTGVATYEFEHFSLSDPTCGDSATSTQIWLTYGGRVSSGAVYCCPGEGEPSTRRKPLVLEGVTLPLAADAVFRRFRQLVRKKPSTVAHVTLVGTFFAGEADATVKTMRGFGHLGCCSLLVIERVERFEEM